MTGKHSPNRTAFSGPLSQLLTLDSTPHKVENVNAHSHVNE